MRSIFRIKPNDIMFESAISLIRNKMDEPRPITGPLYHSLSLVNIFFR